MSKLFKASFVLLFFSFTLIIFQLSCKKEASADSTSTSDLIIFLRRGTNNQYEIWSADANGGNQKYIPIVLPPSYSFSFSNEGGQLKLSSDKTKIYFPASTSLGTTTSIFSCSINGANVTKLIDGVSNNFDVK